MEPETASPALFPSLPVPSQGGEDQQNNAFGQRLFTLGLGLPGCPASMLLSRVVIKSAMSGLRGWIGPVGLCCFPLPYPSTLTNLSLVGIHAQLQTSRAS